MNWNEMTKLWIAYMLGVAVVVSGTHFDMSNLEYWGINFISGILLAIICSWKTKGA